MVKSNGLINLSQSVESTDSRSTQSRNPSPPGQQQFGSNASQFHPIGNNPVNQTRSSMTSLESTPFDEPQYRARRSNHLMNRLPVRGPEGPVQRQYVSQMASPAPIWVDDPDDESLDSNAAHHAYPRVKTGDDVSLGSCDVVVLRRVKTATSLEEASLGSADVLVIDRPESDMPPNGSNVLVSPPKVHRKSAVPKVEVAKRPGILRNKATPVPVGKAPSNAGASTGAPNNLPSMGAPGNVIHDTSGKTAHPKKAKDGNMATLKDSKSSPGDLTKSSKESSKQRRNRSRSRDKHAVKDAEEAGMTPKNAAEDSTANVTEENDNKKSKRLFGLKGKDPQRRSEKSSSNVSSKSKDSKKSKSDNVEKSTKQYPPSPSSSSGKSSPSRSSKRQGRSSLSEKRRLSKEQSSSKSSKTIVDLQKEEDPLLERELEEIALHGGRSALIGGGPIDVEKGSTSTHLSSTRYDAEEEEADKSWFRPLDPNTQPRSPKRRLCDLWGLCVFALVLIVAVVLVVFLVLGLPDKHAENHIPSTALTARQQDIHDVLASITDERVLIDPTTPQFRARQWLMFHDTDTDHLTEEALVQRYSLITFYFATGGDDAWKENNWLKGAECEDVVWTGLNCNPNGEVRALVLDDEGLVGSIPAEVGHLSKLENLILKNNPGLSGTIPPRLGHLTKLRQLGIYNNNLSGTIPPRLARATNLHYINLEKNNLDGSIPLEIAALSHLHTLVLMSNKLEGIVPMDELAKTVVQFLGLSDNRFSSIMEKSLGDIKTLQYLYLDNNNLRGKIPDEIGRLTHLKSVDFGKNSLTGRIPGHISHLKHLNYLNLDSNELTGTVPKELALLTKLVTFNVASNKLQGALPNMSKMTKLANLYVFENQFNGTIPEMIQELQSLHVLMLSSNQFTGTVPTSIQSIGHSLRGLYLSDNKLQGQIPEELCQFAKLEALFLDTNKFVGPIPSCFNELYELRQLFLFDNLLTGTVPRQLEELHHISDIGIEKNQLNGQIPDEVCELVNHNVVDFWADCTGSNPISCVCCTTCCPGQHCV